MPFTSNEAQPGDVVTAATQEFESLAGTLIPKAPLALPNRRT